MDEAVVYTCRTAGCPWQGRPRLLSARMDTNPAAVGQGLFIRVVVLCGDCDATLEAQRPAGVAS